MQALAEAVLSVTETARAIRSQGGGLLFQQIDALQHGLAQAKAAAYAALAEIGDGSDGKAEAATAEMARHGFTGTIVDLQTNLAAIEAAATAWNDALDAVLRAQTDLMFMNARNDSRFREMRAALPGGVSDTLRAQGELDGLIAGFTAVGA